MGRILMVSKPIAPPWNDSSKNLVRDLAGHLERHEAVTLCRRGDPALAGHHCERIYPAGSGAFAPALRDNAIVLARLLAGRRHDLWHFFFAPNPRSSKACELAARVRGAPTVQTVCSAPAEGSDLNELLFADRTVVLSEHTEQRLLAAGVPPESLRRIPPCSRPLSPLSPDARSEMRGALGIGDSTPMLAYPGDLEFSRGAARCLEALAALGDRSDVTLVMACRAKTAAARAAEAQLRELASRLGLGPRVRWVGETDRIHDLIGCADVVLLPSETLFAKMDLPMVLIEAMFLARPALVLAGTPAAELAEQGGARAVEHRADALTAAVVELLDGPDARTRLGLRAREVAIERYHPDAMAGAYEALYDELLV